MKHDMWTCVFFLMNYTVLVSTLLILFLSDFCQAAESTTKRDGLFSKFWNRNDIKVAILEKDFEKVQKILERKTCFSLLANKHEVLSFMAEASGNKKLDHDGDIFEVLLASCGDGQFILNGIRSALLHDDWAVLEMMLSLVQFSVDEVYDWKLLGLIFESCVSARNRRCVETLIDWELPLDSEGANLLHMAADVDDVSLVKLAPVDQVLLDKPNDSGHYPMKSVISKEMAIALNDRWDLEMGLNKSPTWNCTKEMYSMTRNFKIPDRTFINRAKKLAECLGGPRGRSDMFNLEVRREFIVKDSFEMRQPLRKDGTGRDEPTLPWFHRDLNVNVTFEGEIGLDYGGPKLEWLTLLLKSFFKEPSPSDNVYDFTAPLFEVIDEESGMYAPNNIYPPAVYKFAGSIIALALREKVGLKVKLIPAALRMALLNSFHFSMKEFEQQHPSTYRNLMKLTNDPDIKVEDLEFNFENDPKRGVTSDNVHEFVEDKAMNRLYRNYKPALDALGEGFNAITHKAQLFRYFDHDEIGQVLRGGSASFTTKEFLDNSILNGSAESQTMFKEMLDSLNDKERMTLFKFVTGRDSLPFEGISGLGTKLIISLDELNSGFLPTTATCFLTLKFPKDLKSAQEMKYKLFFSIEQSENRFDLA